MGNCCDTEAPGTLAKKEGTKLQGNEVQARDEGDEGEILDAIDIDEPEQDYKKGTN
jgi:hypothetical protein